MRCGWSARADEAMAEFPSPAAAAVGAALDRLNIRYQLHRHEAVQTCTEAAEHVHGIPGIPSKCLLLKTNRAGYFLVIAPCANRLDLQRLAVELGCGRLSFAAAAELETLLRSAPGSVSPFGLMHDISRKIQVVIDTRLAADRYCQFHPKDNRATLVLKTDDFKKFLDWANHPPQIIHLP